MSRPFVSITLAVSLGMALGLALGSAGFWLAGVVALACMVLIIRWGLDSPHFKILLWAWLFALGMVWFLLAQQDSSLLADQIGRQVVVKGLVTEARSGENRQVLTVKLLELEGSEQKPREKLLVRINGGQAGGFSYGQIIQVTGKPELIPESGNPGGFSYRSYLNRFGIYTQIQAYVKPAVVGQGGNLLSRAAWEVQQRARLLSEKVLGSREASVFQGILFGDTDKLDPADKEVFTTTGVLHAFAVSGSNVAFVLFLGLLAFRFLPRVPRLVLTMAVVVFYAVLTGGGGPVVRATIMALVVLAGYSLDRKGDGLNSLALAGLLMLLFEPKFLTDPGFQLSFAATWGLIELVPLLAKRGKTRPSLVKELVYFPIAAQLATLPLLAYYFYQISLVGIAANVVVTWFLAVILEVGLAGISLGLLSPNLGELLLLPLNTLIKITLALLGVLAQVPAAAYWVTRPNLPIVVLYYAALIALVHREKVQEWAVRYLPILAVVCKKWLGRKPVLAGALLALLLLSTALAVLPAGNQLGVEFLDVGQGDSILISSPGGKHFLVDGGPRSKEFDAGKSIVVPYLLNKGIKRLDGVFLTHSHDDHSGGLIEVERTFPTGRFYTAPSPATEDLGLGEELKREVTGRKVPYITLRAGATIELDQGVELQVLSPNDLFEGTRSDLNNNSLVMVLYYGRHSILLTADIEMEALARLRENVFNNYSVIKLPHHGSKYGLDREFFDRQHPLVTVISVGRNSFGQPAPEVSSYWRERGIPVLRTDRDGLTSVKTDGKRLQVFTGRNSRLAYTFR